MQLEGWRKQCVGAYRWTGLLLTVLTMGPREAAEADALEGVQMGVAAAPVVAGLLGAGVALEHGHVAGAQGVLLPQDGGAHQDDLRAASQQLNGSSSSSSSSLALWL